MSEINDCDREVVDRAVAMLRYLEQSGLGSSADVGNLVVAATIQQIWEETKGAAAIGVLLIIWFKMLDDEQQARFIEEAQRVQAEKKKEADSKEVV